MHALLAVLRILHAAALKPDPQARLTVTDLLAALKSAGTELTEPQVRDVVRALGRADRVYRESVRRPGRTTTQGYWLSPAGMRYAATTLQNLTTLGEPERDRRYWT
jgi:hypothetical protein